MQRIARGEPHSGTPLQVGQPLITWLFAKRIELKMLYGQPGFKVDVEFDDARLYPLPADAPLRVAVTVADIWHVHAVPPPRADR